jgi:hypothetical protein
MNPLAAVETVAGAAAPRGPLATLQALADSLAQTAAHAGTAAPALAAASSSAAVGAPGSATVTPANAALHALQGRATLGQMAAEPPLVVRPPAESAPALAGEPAALAARAPAAADASAAPRLPDALAQPVNVTPLHAPPLQPARPRAAAAPPRRGAALPADETVVDALRVDGDAAPPSDDEGETAAPAALFGWLEAEAPADVRSELARGRRVLVVLTAAAPVQGWCAAQAWLVDRRRAPHFAGRWWPGAAAAAGWRRWRVFRDGDPLLARGLASGAGAQGLRLRLGSPAPQIADSALATLELADRIRFAQALGGQWSLLVAAAPPGLEAPR